jgi:hypothetical protein
MFLALSNSIANHRFSGASFVGATDVWLWEGGTAMQWEAGIFIQTN